MIENNNTRSVINAIKARGWEGAARAVLDIIEPVAPLVSQFLLVVQPVSRVIGADSSIGDLARTLDTPEGLEQLRRELANE